MVVDRLAELHLVVVYAALAARENAVRLQQAVRMAAVATVAALADVRAVASVAP